MNKQPDALHLAAQLDPVHSVSTPLMDLHRNAAAELRRLHAEHEALRKAVIKLHATKGRHHTQIAACDLYDLLGLKNERPAK